MKKINVHVMIQVALLIAIEVVLSRFFSIATPVVKIGFGFVPIAVCAMLFGPGWAAAAGGLADLLGAVLFPIGAYFPGFTLSAALTGAVFGLLLRGGETGWARLGAAVCVNSLVISLCLNTLWIAVLSGAPFPVLLPTRLAQSLIMLPVQFIVLRLVQQPVRLYLRRAQRA